jgi:hypothetical protein
VKEVKEVKVKGKRRAYRFAEWKDVSKIVERHLIENKELYEELSEL